TSNSTRSIAPSSGGPAVVGGRAENPAFSRSRAARRSVSEPVSSWDEDEVSIEVSFPYRGKEDAIA
ncbi:MAG: hypothetical protein ACRDGS_14030, partial [Chloroflexota bacterium]